MAPADGIVVPKSADVGTMAQPGATLLTIEDPSRYRLEASVEESYAPRVRVGADVPVRIDALGGLETFGSVVEVCPSADPASRSVVVKIDLPAIRVYGPGNTASPPFPRANTS